MEGVVAVVVFSVEGEGGCVRYFFRSWKGLFNFVRSGVVVSIRGVFSFRLAAEFQFVRVLEVAASFSIPACFQFVARGGESVSRGCVLISFSRRGFKSSARGNSGQAASALQFKVSRRVERHSQFKGTSGEAYAARAIERRGNVSSRMLRSPASRRRGRASPPPRFTKF